MLELQQISKTYPDGTQALNNINLSFSHGMIGLLGPNGAGKSTLMRTIACLQLPDRGQILLDGVNVLERPEQMRATLGYLPQYFGVYPNMSCLALLKHIASLKGLTSRQQNRQMPELLALTNLEGVANKNVSAFSGGMRQRFGIAQALLGDPSVIIMDEPTAGLDPMEREKLHDLLVSISQSKLVLLSTHIVEDVENLCQHVTLMFNGKISAHDEVPILLRGIEGKIWQLNDGVTPELGAVLLSKQFQFGVAKLRYFSSQAPHALATQVQATLQDLYFYQLKTHAQETDHANR